MANYHLNVSIVKRSAGRSATAAAAYRSATRIRDERTGELHDYSRKGGVVHSEVMLPEGAPERLRERSELWNAAELAERRKDAQVAREYEGSLPRELPRAEQVEVAREFARGLVERGMCADVCIHDRGDGNPHFHIMATTRDVSEEGFGGKNRGWNDRAELERDRERFAEIQNRALERAGRGERVDHRSYAERGVELEPTRHEGPRVREIEEREMRACERDGRGYEPVTEVRRENLGIRERNDLAERLRAEIERLSERAREMAREVADRVREAVREVAGRAEPARGRARGEAPPPGQSEQGPCRDAELVVRAVGRCDEMTAEASRMREEASRIERELPPDRSHEIGRAQWDVSAAEQRLASARAASSRADARLEELMRHPRLNAPRIGRAREDAASALAERADAARELSAARGRLSSAREAADERLGAIRRSRELVYGARDLDGRAFKLECAARERYAALDDASARHVGGELSRSETWESGRGWFEEAREQARGAGRWDGPAWERGRDLERDDGWEPGWGREREREM